jgi:molybdopterin molybdotransferase
MDGYAVRDPVGAGDALRVIGEAAAGHPFHGAVGPGEAVRIFTGAPMPEGANRVVIQEDVTRDGDGIAVRAMDAARHVRSAGGDFAAGHVVSAPRRLTARDVALLAAMGCGRVPVARRPVVAILATGDELRAPGAALGEGMVFASNSYGLAAMARAMGAEARLLPIARDDAASLAMSFRLAEGTDLLLTVGGASVGEHDLVAGAAAEAGIDLAFAKVAMRPGKPLMAGRGPNGAMVGLPGNPVSALVCAHVFVQPMIDRMLGLPPSDRTAVAQLAGNVPANGPRAHYMRATIAADGACLVAEHQDSSLLTVLAQADALVIRPPHDPARRAGEPVRILPMTI